MKIPLAQTKRLPITVLTPATVAGHLTVLSEQMPRISGRAGILVYLAGTRGRLLAPSGQDRFDALAWTLWQVGGLGSMLGQWLHFEGASPDRIGRLRLSV
jgi:glutathione S-transferase